MTLSRGIWQWHWTVTHFGGCFLLLHCPYVELRSSPHGNRLMGMPRKVHRATWWPLVLKLVLDFLYSSSIYWRAKCEKKFLWVFNSITLPTFPNEVLKDVSPAGYSNPTISFSAERKGNFQQQSTKLFKDMFFTFSFHWNLLLVMR